MTQYAVGDIQGCYRELITSLEKVNFNSSSDELWVAGDLINRGPQSMETLNFLYENRKSVRCVLGNHDLYFLSIYFGQKKPTKHDTFDEILSHKNCEPWVEWLRDQGLCHYDESNKFLMVHAGVAPQWTLNDVLNLNIEIKNVLKSDNVKNYLLGMYGNEPVKWDDNLTGINRLRCITNFFTRIRICDAHGALQLEYKNDLENIPKNYYPWFLHPKRKTKKQKIIFGHWASLGGYTDNNKIFGLDTGCVWGGKLTIMRLDNLEKFQTPKVKKVV